VTAGRGCSIASGVVQSPVAPAEGVRCLDNCRPAVLEPSRFDGTVSPFVPPFVTRRTSVIVVSPTVEVMNDTGSPKEIGFTGTRHGMTQSQLDTTRRLFEENPEWVTVHHGGRVGADAQMHEIALDQGREAVVHHSTRRFAANVGEPTVPPVSPAEARRSIVDSSAVLIATPAWPGSVQKALSSTVRYARSRGVPVILVWPNGSTSE